MFKCNWFSKANKVSEPPRIDDIRETQLAAEESFKQQYIFVTLADAIVKANHKLHQYNSRFYATLGKVSILIYDPKFDFEVHDFMTYYESRGYTVTFKDEWPGLDKEDAGHYVKFVISWPFKEVEENESTE